MKTALLIFTLTLISALGFSNTGFAQSPVNFIVSNQQSDALGTVAVNATNGTYYGTVPGNTTDTIVMSPDTLATSVTINGQTVPQGVKAIVTLATGKQVAVLWTSPNAIVTIDQEELGSNDVSQPKNNKLL